MLRLDPGPFTLRQLLTMARAYRHDTWERTALVASVIINVNRPKGSRAIMPNELNPIALEEKRNEKPVEYISAKKLAQIVTRNR